MSAVGVRPGTRLGNTGLQRLKSQEEAQTANHKYIPYIRLQVIHELLLEPNAMKHVQL